jgi:L-amino acid N-acyltransferase YncA/uncharacterized membrane protein YdcZ (DUF606 family)
MKYLPFLVLILAGAALTTQSAVNSQLRGGLHSVMWAVLVSYLIGTLAAALVLVSTQASLPTLADVSAIRWYQWTGGALGMVYIAASVFSLQRVGAASLFALVVTGQLLTALLFDQLGLLGLVRSPLTLSRLAGALLLIAGANPALSFRHPCMQLHPLTAGHWPAVRAIYEQGIATGKATFETQAPACEAWDRAHLTHNRLIAIDDAGIVLGWAALSPVSSRYVYGSVAELSIYIAAEAGGQIGRQLLQALIADLEAYAIWTLQTGPFEENTASIALHTQAGFSVIGHRERIGHHHGMWHNTVPLERRSPSVGID